MFSDKSTVVVTVVSTSEYVLVGDNVTLLPNKLKAFCESENCDYQHAQGGTVEIVSPSNPVIPSVTILAASPISRCADIRLDVTVTSGRGSAPWEELSWTASNINSNVTEDIESHLSSLSGHELRVFTIDNSFLEAGDYSFSFCATNMFLQTSCSQKNITVSQSTTVPTVLLGGTDSIFRSAEITVYGFAYIPACNGGPPSSVGLTYAFELSKDGVVVTDVESISKNPRNFKVAGYTLEADSVYKLVLTASRNGIFSTATHEIFVKRSSTVVASILQGSYININFESSLSIDGLQSYDPDYPNDKDELLYSWKCIELFPAHGSTCPVSFADQPIVEFDATQFEVSRQYQFTLSVWHSDITNSADNTSIVVSVLPGPAIPQVYFTNIAPKYNRGDRIKLSSIVVAEFSRGESSWSAFDSDGNDFALGSSNIRGTSLTKNIRKGTFSFELRIGKNQLEDGVKYIFRVSASYFPELPDASAYTDAVININKAPIGGSFVVNPNSGTALSTKFEFLATGWTDDTEDFPLKYRFTYVVSKNKENLVRDYTSISFAEAYLGEGDPVTCHVWVADIYESAKSEEVSIIVHGVSTSQLFQSFQNLADVSSGDPTVVWQLISAMSAAANAVDCSSASDAFCTALNREICSTTANMCGPCLEEYPVGEYSDANSACTCMSGCSPRDDAKLFATIPIQTLQITSKSCPNDCSSASQGECVFTGWTGAQVIECAATDSTCRASCICEAGWYSADCSKNISEASLIQSAKEMMCVLAYDAQESQDISESIIISRATTVSAMLLDMSMVSDYAYTNCSYVVIDSILQGGDIAVMDEVLPFVLDSLSKILERGIDLTNPVYEDVIRCIEKINEQRQLTMSTGETPVEFYMRNLRYSTWVSYLGDFVNSTEWIVARSTLEEALESNVSRAVITSDAALNGSIVNNDVSVGVSLWEILIRLGQNTANSSVVHLQTKVLSGSLDNLPGTNLEVVLYNHYPVEYDSSEILTGSSYCAAAGDRLPYLMNVSCGDDYEIVKCPGNNSVYVDYTCSSYYDSPQCSVWDEAGNFISNSHCAATEYDAYSTTCVCDGMAGVGDRRSLSSYEFQNPQNYDFMSTKKVNYRSLSENYVAFRNIPDSGDTITIFIVTLIYTSVACFVGIWMLQMERDLEFKNVDRVKIIDDIVSVALGILASEHSYVEQYTRFRNALWYKNEYISAFKWRKITFYTACLEHFDNWITVCGYFLNFMLVHAIFAWSVYNDEGDCEVLSTRNKCLAYGSSFSFHVKCEWVSERCSMRSPITNEVSLFAFVLLTSVLCIPLNKLWKHCAVHSIAIIKDYRRCTELPSVEVNAKKASAKTDLLDDDVSKSIFDVDQIGQQICSQLPLSAGTLSDEVIYVLSEAKTVVQKGELDENVVPQYQTRSDLLRQELNLDLSGSLVNKSTSILGLKRSGTHRLTTKLLHARAASMELLSSVAYLQSEQLVDILLIQQYLLHCLPYNLCQFSRYYLYESPILASEPAKTSLDSNFMIFALPIYIVAAISIILTVGFQWYGQVTTTSWACFVAISCVYDFALNTPARIFCKIICIPSYIIAYFLQILKRLRFKFDVILSKEIPVGLELVQHYNPTCRVARSSLYHTSICGAFQRITDVDALEILGSCSANRNMLSFPSTIKVINFIVGLFPLWLMDILIEELILLLPMCTLILLYYLSKIAFYVPLVLAITLVALFIALKSLKCDINSTHNGDIEASDKYLDRYQFREDMKDLCKSKLLNRGSEVVDEIELKQPDLIAMRACLLAPQDDSKTCQEDEEAKKAQPNRETGLDDVLNNETVIKSGKVTHRNKGSLFSGKILPIEQLDSSSLDCSSDLEKQATVHSVTRDVDNQGGANTSVHAYEGVSRSPGNQVVPASEVPPPKVDVALGASISRLDNLKPEVVTSDLVSKALPGNMKMIDQTNENFGHTNKDKEYGTENSSNHEVPTELLTKIPLVAPPIATINKSSDKDFYEIGTEISNTGKKNSHHRQGQNLNSAHETESLPVFDYFNTNVALASAESVPSGFKSGESNVVLGIDIKEYDYASNYTINESGNDENTEGSECYTDPYEHMSDEESGEEGDLMLYNGAMNEERSNDSIDGYGFEPLDESGTYGVSTNDENDIDTLLAGIEGIDNFDNTEGFDYYKG